MRAVYTLGHGKINVTIGSALDLFGGNLNFDKVLELVKSEENGSEKEPRQ